VYTVEERVLEPRSVVHALAEQTVGGPAPLVRCQWVREGACVRLRGAMGEVVARPGRIVLCAGEGNAELARVFGDGEDATRNGTAGKPPRSVDARGGLPGQQVRPLHMVMVRGALPEVFGHCVGVADRPRLTITSQTDIRGDAGTTVWYVGGEVAECGVERDAEAQIAAARAEVRACLPWVDLTGTEWAAVRVNRAEGTIGDERGGMVRPDEPVVESRAQSRLVVAYPTKLAFAPLLAGMVSDRVRDLGAPPSPNTEEREDLRAVFSAFERPLIAPLPWEREGVRWR
jgi:hypothetical protein